MNVKSAVHNRLHATVIIGGALLASLGLLPIGSTAAHAAEPGNPPVVDISCGVPFVPQGSAVKIVIPVGDTVIGSTFHAVFEGVTYPAILNPGVELYIDTSHFLPGHYSQSFFYTVDFDGLILDLPYSEICNFQGFDIVAPPTASGETEGDSTDGQSVTFSPDISGHGDVTSTVSLPPVRGDVTIDPVTKVITYTPHADAYGDDTFTVSFTDDLNQTVSMDFHVVLPAQPQPPATTPPVTTPPVTTPPVTTPPSQVPDVVTPGTSVTAPTAATSQNGLAKTGLSGFQVLILSAGAALILGLGVYTLRHRMTVNL